MLKDGRSDFNDFILENPNRSGLQDNITAKKVFDFMNQIESIWKMIQHSDSSKPAIMPLVEDIEKLVDSDFELNDFNKQSIGAMSATILRPFGYLKEDKGRRIGKCGFTTGSVFKLSETPKIKIIQELSILPNEKD